MKHAWFRPRGYMHFDVPVLKESADQLASPLSVAKHSWLPLIHYHKKVKRYKPCDGRTIYKNRPIMYASHRDACILSRYSFLLSGLLEKHYLSSGLHDHVIAYRALGKSNYDFSAIAYRFALERRPCVVTCFDISGFFDHLDHGILKDRLKRILGVEELSRDWYNVFRHVTRFRKIERDDLAKNPKFENRIRDGKGALIGTIEEVLAERIAITKNSNRYGIPQGTPISSTLSNLYLMDLDQKLASICNERKALYQRYSDDILFVSAIDDEPTIETALRAGIEEHALCINDEKTERVAFESGSDSGFQYLGFEISPTGVVVRASSLSRQWRKAKRSIAKTRKIGQEAIAAGTADRIYTKKLHRRFQPVGVRNFSSYTRHAASAFGSKKMIRQVMRLERMVARAIRDMND